MSGSALHPSRVAAAAAFIGGMLVVALPQHVLGITQLVIVTVAAGAGLHALSAHVPPTGWMSPFKYMSPFRRALRSGRRKHGSDEIEAIRAKLSARRQRVWNGPPVPPDVLRLLQPVVAATLDIDPTDESELTSARSLLAPLTWSVLATEPLARPYWFRTLRPNEWEVADVVHTVLDELEDLPRADARRPVALDPGSRAP